MWRIETDRNPSWEMKAGAKRYSVVDKLGNVRLVTDNYQHALQMMDELNGVR